MSADIWKDRDVARSFLSERALMIPDRPRQLEVLLRVIRLSVPQPRRVLDLGAGDGLLLSTVLEAYPEAHGLAVDFSPLMLEQAGQRLSKYGQRIIGIREADLQNPAWRDGVTGPFDVVVSGFAIHHLPDERKGTLYQEIYHLLADGGIFLNSEHVSSPSPNIEKMFDDAMAEHLYQRRSEKGEKVTLQQTYNEFLTRADRAANILAPLEDQCRWLREIGYREVDCFWKYFELAIFGGMR